MIVAPCRSGRERTDDCHAGRPCRPPCRARGQGSDPRAQGALPARLRSQAGGGGRDCFLPAGVRIAYQNFPEFTDRDAFVEVYRQAACQGGVYDLHHATNWDIRLTGADRATGLWSLKFRTILTGLRQVVRLVVEYEDLYQRVDGRWYIAETVSRITSALTEQIAEDGGIRVLAWEDQPAVRGPAIR